MTIKDFEQLRTFQEIEKISGSTRFKAKALQRRVREAIDRKYLCEHEGRTLPEHQRRLLDCIVMDGDKKVIHLGKWEEFIEWQMKRPVQ